MEWPVGLSHIDLRRSILAPCPEILKAPCPALFLSLGLAPLIGALLYCYSPLGDFSQMIEISFMQAFAVTPHVLYGFFPSMQKWCVVRFANPRLNLCLMSSQCPVNRSTGVGCGSTSFKQTHGELSRHLLIKPSARCCPGASY